MPRGKRRAGWVAASLVFLAPAVQAADDDTIRRAIERGVTSLKKEQTASGTWPCPESPVGATGLAGLTLLECDVAPDDPSVRKAVKVLRPEIAGMSHTYALATTILFLDRLDEPSDVPLIQWMAVRLLAGQGSSGGWTYECPLMGRDEVRRLTVQLRARPAPPKGAPGNAPDPRALPQGVQQAVKLINPLGRPGLSDNSNTKFATLALWVARRHGVPVDKALALVETRFRTTQNGDGGWGYIPNSPGVLARSFGTMTCAGLLGLAIGHGSAHEMVANAGGKAPRAPAKPPRDPAQDPAIRAGLVVLGNLIGGPLDNQVRNQIAIFNPKGDEFYFLWALERVAVAYGLDSIGNKDWYAWGSQYLLANQKPDGSWQGRYGGGVDTCFALLFLRRANLSKDLSVILRGRVQPEVPAGGAEGQGPKAANPPAPKPAPEAPPPPPAKDQPPPAPAREPAGLEAEAARLRAALVQAPPTRQQELLGTYKDAKGVAYTQALAEAIPQLKGDEVLRKARAALAERLARMTAATLQARLRDGDVEMRRAAALACAMKEEKSTIPDLIRLLEDPEEGVVRAAHAALKALSGGVDFGPAAQAGRAERLTAANAWKEWWRKQPAK
jgi:hypothetical protein